MVIDEPERVWGFAEAAGPTAGGFGVLGKDDDGKREKLCVRETFRVRIWDANFKVFAETLVRLNCFSCPHDGGGGGVTPSHADTPPPPPLMDQLQGAIDGATQARLYDLV